MNARVAAQLGYLRDEALALACFVTPVAVVLSFLAFDDISTDNATSFTLEYLVQKGCAAWCFLVAVFLTFGRHRVLGVISLLVLAGAVWGQRGIGPGTIPSWQPEYLATVGALIWFLALSIVLIVVCVRGKG